MKTNSTNNLVPKMKMYSLFALVEVIIGEALVAVGWNTKAENVKYTLMVLGAVFLLAGIYTLFVKVNRLLCLAYPNGRPLKINGEN